MRYPYQLTFVLCAVFGLATSGCTAPEETSMESDRPPNILIVLLDDTGFADFGAAPV